MPEWLERLKNDFYQRRLSCQHLSEIHEVAIKAALKDQELAGIDVVSDGELRRDNDIDYLLARMPGIEILHPAKAYYYDYYDDRHPGAVAQPGGHRARAWRTTSPSPSADRPAGEVLLHRAVLALPPGPQRGLRQLGRPGAALAEVLNAEAHRLAGAGATLLQIDEPFLAGYPEEVGLAIEAINTVTAGVPVTWALHVCYGNRYARPSWEGHYDFLFPAVLDADVDQLVLEFARKGYDDLQLIRKYGWDREPRPRRDRREVGGDRDRRGRRGAHPACPRRRAAERLIVNPDCGLRHLPADIARAKLRAMVEGTAVVRREISGVPEGEPALPHHHDHQSHDTNAGDPTDAAAG